LARAALALLHGRAPLTLIDLSSSRYKAAIGSAAGGTAAAGAGIDPTTGVILGSAVGDYSCGAWFKAAARNDPTLLIAPQWVPTIQLLRDLKEFSGGIIDVTPEEALKNTVNAVQRSAVTVKVGGADIPVAVLPVVPVGGTPGKVLDDRSIMGK
jgi:hypothetical protein